MSLFMPGQNSLGSHSGMTPLLPESLAATLLGYTREAEMMQQRPANLGRPRRPPGKGEGRGGGSGEQA